ncbi:MAG: N-acetylneuraminate synthase family protein, partial [bacterium]|nr:N-acetylneuraminate synthase family protein [bacterium]
CYKIASPSLTDDDLLRHIRSMGRPVILSTGMSDMSMVRHAVSILGTDNLVLMQCTSAYPKVSAAGADPLAYVNLRVIDTYRREFGIPVGLSSHLNGIMPSYAAVAMGASVIEHHITLQKSDWGSDQAFSLEPNEITNLVRMIRELHVAKGDGAKSISSAEEEAMKKLRRK